jgi:hypothetical protein
MLYQWGRTKAWSATDEEVEDWDWRWCKDERWNVNNPCPEGWRVPTSEELNSLAAADSEWAIRNGVGGLLIGTAPNQIFLPAAGSRRYVGGGLRNGGTVGGYWSSYYPAPLAHLFPSLRFSGSESRGSRGAIVISLNRHNAQSIRCVAKIQNPKS